MLLNDGRTNNGRMQGGGRMNNGRTVIQPPSVSKQFELYDQIPAKQCINFRGTPTPAATPLYNEFKSDQNKQKIQNCIRYGVFLISNKQYIIHEVNDDELNTVMNSIFKQHSHNSPYNIQQQIETLNKMVVDDCIKRCYTEAQTRLHYLKDINTLPTPISLPVMTNTHHQQLPMHQWF